MRRITFSLLSAPMKKVSCMINSQHRSVFLAFSFGRRAGYSRKQVKEEGKQNKMRLAYFFLHNASAQSLHHAHVNLYSPAAFAQQNLSSVRAVLQIHKSKGVLLVTQHDGLIIRAVMHPVSFMYSRTGRCVLSSKPPVLSSGLVAHAFWKSGLPFWAAVDVFNQPRDKIWRSPLRQ